ncbi:MAG: adenylosuccinate synthase [Planctomycetes bacterium]|nr:adenylosuccinate synthase [Planctomycetota bacterium]
MKLRGNTCVVGLQWGDEAKGKITDLLSEQCGVVVRFLGGSNAGHTVVVGDQTFKLHLIPSGIVHKDVLCVIAGGVVLDPEVFEEELANLREGGVSFDGRLKISQTAHVVFPYHKLEDQLKEASRGKSKIGTTARGIGPCYCDKAARTLAVRVGDLFYADMIEQRIREIVDYKNRLLLALYGSPGVPVEQMVAKAKRYAEILRPFVCDTTALLQDAIAENRRLLFEGAQGTLLDIDHGTFPYVTSSNASACGVSAGAGVPAKIISTIVGVAKAYTTRVGTGPFPSEQDNDIGNCIRERGREYGTTTGRPRRCGWFDAFATRYSIKLGGIDKVALMLLDVLSGFETLKICTGYRYKGQMLQSFPTDAEVMKDVEPVYEEHPGWSEEIDGVRTFADLPANAQSYVKRLEALLETPIAIVSVGPERTQTLLREDVI